MFSFYSSIFPLQHFRTSANTRYPMAAPSVFVTTSSNWQKPRSVKSCTVSNIMLVANAAYTQYHHLRRNGTAAGSNAPNGRNSRIFSTKYRSGSHWFPPGFKQLHIHARSRTRFSGKQRNRKHHRKIDYYQKTQQKLGARNRMRMLQPFLFLYHLPVFPRCCNRHKADTDCNGMRQIPECIKKYPVQSSSDKEELPSASPSIFSWPV